MKIIKSFFLILFLLFFIPINAFCALPFFHVYIAEKWMENFEKYDESQKKAFLLGTLFPDIRYLGVISREETHEPRITINDLIMTADPFLKGKRLHSFVDETRSKIIREQGIMNRLSDIPTGNKVFLLKILEDEILYPKKNWVTICQYLKEIDDNEKTYSIPLQALKKWHNTLILYFMNRPSKLLEQLTLLDQGFLTITKEEVKIWRKLVPKLSKDEEIQAYFSVLIEEFENAFKDFEHPN